MFTTLLCIFNCPVNFYYYMYCACDYATHNFIIRFIFLVYVKIWSMYIIKRVDLGLWKPLRNLPAR